MPQTGSLTVARASWPVGLVKDGQGSFVRVHGIEIPLVQAPALALGVIFIQRRDFLRSSLSQTLKKDSRAAWALSRWDASKLLAAWTKAGSWACSASTCSISPAATTASWCSPSVSWIWVSSRMKPRGGAGARRPMIGAISSAV